MCDHKDSQDSIHWAGCACSVTHLSRQCDHGLHPQYGGHRYFRRRSQCPGRAVSLKAVRLAPFKEQITFKDLVVGNPDGYQNKTFLNLGETKAMNTAELTSRIILAIVGGVLQQAVGILPDDLVNAAGAALGTTANVGKQVITTGAGTGGVLIKGAEKIGGSIIGGLRPKKKKTPTRCRNDLRRVDT